MIPLPVPQQSSAGPALQGVLMRELSDGRELELEILGVGRAFELPLWPPLQVGPLSVDLSPTRHTVYLVVSALLLLAVLLPLARRVTRDQRLARAPKGLANAVEALVLFFRDEVVRPNVGPGADGYSSYILTLFFFILTMNLLGLVPFGATPTANLSVTGALALVTLVVVEVSGIRTLGLSGYMRTIFHAPPGMGRVGSTLMLVALTPVELLGKVTKPFALMIRLFANMIAGHILVLSLLGMIFFFARLSFGRWAVAGASVGMVTAFLIMEVFVAFLQAYIFAMLTAVFVGLIRRAH